MVVGDDDGHADYFRADKAWLYIMVLTVGYMISRGLAKSGSRDPYGRVPLSTDHRSHPLRARQRDGPQRPLRLLRTVPVLLTRRGPSACAGKRGRPRHGGKVAGP